MRILKWVWNKGVVGTFLSGIFALLPIIVTIGVVVWVAGYVVAILGPGSWVGIGLKSLGLKFVASEWVAYSIGCVIAVTVIWAFGLLVQSKAKAISKALLEWPKRIPFLGSIYGTAQQVVQMVNRDDDEAMKGMEVVYVRWGGTMFHPMAGSDPAVKKGGGGFLALSPQGVYDFGDQSCRIVYIPTSPVPMSGGCIFWPVNDIKVVDMTPDALMQIYLSLGVLAKEAVPDQYCCSVESLSTLDPNKCV